MSKLSGQILLFAFLAANGNIAAQQPSFAEIFTPLQQLSESACARSLGWNEVEALPLGAQQIALFQQAYAAAQAADDSTLQAVVSDSQRYRDLYGFFNQLRSLELNPEGSKFIIQAPFNPANDVHAGLAARFANFAPDVIVTILWCLDATARTSVRQTVGYVYLARVEGQWKFYTP
ncbi:MAG: hypothetical protein R3F50_01170 [Gammaproteobacteria bacterium]